MQTFFCRGSLIEGDPSVSTCMTNDYLIDDGLLSLGGSIRSDITPTNDGGGLGDNGGWNKCTTPRFTILSRTPRSAVLPLSHLHVRIMMATTLTFQEEGTTTCTEDYVAKSRVIASTTRTGHLEGYTSADVGWQFPFVSRRPCCCVLPAPRPEQKAARVRSTCVAGCATGYKPCSAPMSDSEYGVDVCIGRADERSCMVQCGNGYSIVGYPAVWTCMTNDSWTDGGLPTCEPEVCADLSLGSSVASDRDGTLCSHTCTVSCALGHVASDMDDAVFSSVSLIQVYKM